MPLGSKEKQDFINSFVVHLFADKINPKKFAMSIASALNDSNLAIEIEKLWNERNKQVEQKIYQEFGSNSSKEIKQISEQKQKKIDGFYKFTRFLEDASANEVKNWLPEDKLLFNQDIFYNRLRGLDITNIDPTIEKRIIQFLEKDSIGMSKQEVLLYYSLIKANKLSMVEDQSKIRKEIEESKFHKALGSALLGLIYPRRINSDTIGEINEKVKIERDVIRDNLIDKIKNQKFSPYPYLLLFGFQKIEKLFTHFINLANAMKYLGENPEKIINYTIFFILFKNSSENFLKLCNMQKSPIDFINAKTVDPFTSEGFAMTRLLDTLFYALCTQIYEINKNYQQSDDIKKIKVYKLYSSEDRLRMIIQNSLAVAFKSVQGLKIDHQKLFGTVTRYVEKERDFLTKDDLFGNILDFENIEII